MYVFGCYACISYCGEVLKDLDSCKVTSFSISTDLFPFRSDSQLPIFLSRVPREIRLLQPAAEEEIQVESIPSWLIFGWIEN